MTTPTPQPPTALICPKCRGEMRQYERTGVTIDQCADCRGIFLDRGELERLLDANEAYDSRAREQAPEIRAQDGGDGGGGHGGSGQQGQKRRGGFLGGLFGDD